MKKRILLLAIVTVFSLTLAMPALAAPVDTADPWARDRITEAIGKGFVPSDIQNNYKDVITREEFCRMAVKWIEYTLGKSVTEILSGNGLKIDQDVFSDTSNSDILAAYMLGIISGEVAPSESRPGVFNPRGNFTRQQAAVMITNTCRAIGANVSNPPKADFEDMARVDSWAVQGIGFVRANGIMSGLTSNPPYIFDPHSTFTRQESILLFNNVDPAKLPTGTSAPTWPFAGSDGFPVSVAPAKHLNLPNSIGEKYLFAVGDIVIENQMCRIELADGVLYDINAEAVFINLMKLAEETTGLSFYPKGSRWENEKVVIAIGDFYGVAYTSGVDMGSNGAIFEDGIVKIMLHELMHIIHLRNVPIVSRMFCEGFAEQTARYIFNSLDNDFGDHPSMQDMDPVMEKEVFSDRFEEYFRKDEYIFDDNGAQITHMAGFFFGDYINKIYGVNSYLRLLRGFYEQYKTGKLKEDDLIPYIKLETSENVFVDFSKWYWQNKNNYIEENPNILVQGKTHSLYPRTSIDYAIHGGYFITDAFRMNTSPDGAIIDLTDARAYIKHRGYEFSISLDDFDGHAEFRYAFYGDDGKRIDIKDAQVDEFGRYHNQNITKIYIIGNDAPITCFFSYLT